MINDFLKNICLIIFALIGPISLPAGGIQQNCNKYKLIYNPKEIILSSNCSLYAYPETNAKKLAILDSGSSLSILHTWKQREIWLRVELLTNHIIDNPHKITRGWIKI